MPARRVCAFLTIIVWAALHADPAGAGQGVTVGADVVFYGDNTEFHNPFREGETIFGATGRIDGQFEISGKLTLSLGVFGNQRFGSERSFEQVRPVIAMAVGTPRSRFIFGTLATPRAGFVPGPDRTGPHGLLPPLQRETLAFDRPYEAGFQWIVESADYEHDTWLQWQRLNTGAHRERLDAGGRAQWRLTGAVSLPVQAHLVHEGGQLHASGPVRDSVALATGVVLSSRSRHAPQPGGQPIAGLKPSVELLGLWSHDTPDREQPQRTRDGAAFFARAAVEGPAWRAHLIVWRGDDFLKDEGDPNYLSIRRDGTRYRGVRDYAEAGATKTFSVARNSVIEVSFRLHRVERHYEYSYRVVGVVRARARIK
jgi:hypothetical protein